MPIKLEVDSVATLLALADQLSLKGPPKTTVDATPFGEGGTPSECPKCGRNRTFDVPGTACPCGLVEQAGQSSSQMTFVGRVDNFDGKVIRKEEPSPTRLGDRHRLSLSCAGSDTGAIQVMDIVVNDRMLPLLSSLNLKGLGSVRVTIEVLP